MVIQTQKGTIRASRERADGHLVQTRNGSGDDDGHANGAESNRSSIGNQGHARAPERRKAKANKHGRSDCHRGAETCRTFDEATEGIGDKQGLEAPVIGKAGKGILDYFKFARFHGHVVNPDCRYDNPDNGEETESGSHQC